MKKNFYLTPYKYANPCNYEKWFEQKAKEGWYPDKLGHFSSMKMTMNKRKPKNYKYVVDLQAKATDEYKNIYIDCGWEYVGQMSSMHIWCQEYTNKEPESFTDNDSLIRRNKRFVIAISAVFWVIMMTIMALVVVFILEALGVLSLSSDSVDIIVDRVLPIVGLSLVELFIGYSIKKVKKDRNII